MPGESNRTLRTAGRIVLGLLLLGGGVLWELFWLFLLAWVWPPELGVAGFLAVCFGLGIAACAVGVTLLAGSAPGRRTWVVVGAVTLGFAALLGRVGYSTSAHITDVDAVAKRALSERVGDPDLTSACEWEYDEDEAEVWSCDVTYASVRDVCFVWVASRSGGALGATDSYCEGDREVVAELVASEYRKLRGVAKTARFCWEQSSSGNGGGELWRCDLEPDRGDGYCYATVTWREGGRVSAAALQCEREVVATVLESYARRSGAEASGARCVEDHQDENSWTCTFTGATEDRCILGFAATATGRVEADIAYCESELAAKVDRAVERLYLRRTQLESATAACRLEEDDEWACIVRVPGKARDSCDIAIRRREAGPKVIFELSTCRSGRL
jgi:hypothetical protein